MCTVCLGQQSADFQINSQSWEKRVDSDITIVLLSGKEWVNVNHVSSENCETWLCCIIFKSLEHLLSEEQVQWLETTQCWFLFWHSLTLHLASLGGDDQVQEHLEPQHQLQASLPRWSHFSSEYEDVWRHVATVTLYSQATSTSPAWRSAPTKRRISSWTWRRGQQSSSTFHSRWSRIRSIWSEWSGHYNNRGS